MQVQHNSIILFEIVSYDSYFSQKSCFHYCLPFSVAMMSLPGPLDLKRGPWWVLSPQLEDFEETSVVFARTRLCASKQIPHGSCFRQPAHCSQMQIYENAFPEAIVVLPIIKWIDMGLVSFGEKKGGGAVGFQGVRRLILSHKDLQEIMLSSVTRRRAWSCLDDAWWWWCCRWWGLIMRIL